MGTFCFIILIDDALKDTSTRGKNVDDSIISIRVNNAAPNFTILKEALSRLHEWAISCDVTIKHKTMEMHINLGNEVFPPPAITLSSQTLQVVKAFKLLSVSIDNGLTWKSLGQSYLNLHLPPLLPQNSRIF